MPLSNYPNGIRVDDIATIDENGLVFNKVVYEIDRVGSLNL